MGWLMNLFMLGKGSPSGESFTAKSLNGTVGTPRVFVDKVPSSGINPTLFFKHLIQR